MYDLVSLALNLHIT